VFLFEMSFTPARARYDAHLEALKRHFRSLLQRDLTPREEHWLELSAPLLPLVEERVDEERALPRDEERSPDQPVPLTKSA